MMETLYELRSDTGFCRLFDFFADAKEELERLVKRGKFTKDDLYIARVVTE